jgi:putative nucleotidyltransferase with HDIG domain
LKHNVRRYWNRALEACPVWIALFVTVVTWCLLPRNAFLVPQVEEGSIANRTFIADRDLSIPNEAATSSLQQQAEEKVPSVYDFDTSSELERRRQLSALFEAGRAALAGADEGETTEKNDAYEVRDLLAWLGEASPLGLEAETVEVLRRREFSTELEDRLGGVLARVLSRGVVEGKARLLESGPRGITVQKLPAGERQLQLDLYKFLDHPEQVQEFIERELLAWATLSSQERRHLTRFLLTNIDPNLTPNTRTTLELRQKAASEVGTVAHSIRQGEVIVRQGGVVDALAARAIGEMAGTRDVARLLLSGLGTVLLTLAAALLVWLASGGERHRDRSRHRQLSEGLILLMLQLVGARFAYFVAGAIGNAIQQPPYDLPESYTWAIPLASLALTSVLLYGRNMALVLSLVFSLLVGHVVGGDEIWRTMFYALASSLAAVYALDHQQFKQRSVLNRAGLVIGVVNMVSLLALKAIGGEVAGGVPQLGFDLVCGFIGGLLAAAVTSFAVPVFESLFSITTHIKLIELANPNLPLLRRLALEAPGTFQHSLAVANLAKSGCEAIEGNSVLVNTGALYHDIGKIFRPQYFIENQLGGQNPHDKIQPSMSALIITNHVKEGLELGYQSNLPQPILEAIEQHHGTHLIKFFYNKAKERCDPETEEIRDDEFRYPGPKPQSKEMGVLMLADAVEAASRTLVAPSRQKLRSVLRAVFDNCLEDSQLDNTNLTLGDLRKVEDAFLRVLTNIYHRRIDYPGFDFNRPLGEQGSQRSRGRRGPEESGFIAAPLETSGLSSAEAEAKAGSAEKEERRAS